MNPDLQLIVIDPLVLQTMAVTREMMMMVMTSGELGTEEMEEGLVVMVAHLALVGHLDPVSLVEMVVGPLMMTMMTLIGEITMSPGQAEALYKEPGEVALREGVDTSIEMMKPTTEIMPRRS